MLIILDRIEEKNRIAQGWSGGFMFSNNQLALTKKLQGNRKTDCTQFIL